ncbi:MAG: AraC family transcriptional regulator [Firmicutes bacterium]|nr:AraC family transcriptional regulator [Bacillota bacterium]
MNYYERIQRAIRYMEGRLDSSIKLEDVAREAYMSLSNFYRMFFSLVGYRAKEYIRLRRMSKAIEDIERRKDTILNIAIKYGYGNHTSFTKAFKRIIGVTPSEFRKQGLTWEFQEIDILDKYYSKENEEFMELYPDIKVLKEIKPMRVAYYCYYGKNPELKAFETMSNWMSENKIDIESEKIRIFGFNNPGPSNYKDIEYGYEVCVTISNDIEVIDPLVKTKIMPGGLYAVCGVKNLVIDGEGKAIIDAWKRLKSWLEVSKYEYGEHQCMEEHLKFDDEYNYIDGMDIYMPIKLKGTYQK